MFFSIIIPTYNREDLIKEAVKSVIQQTFLDWELIIIDDGSTDNTKEEIGALIENDSRIIYHYQENQERSTARNNGILMSKGNYICFLDSDDTYLSNHLHVFYDMILKDKSKHHFLYSLKTGDEFIYRGNKFEEVFLSDIHSQQVCIKRPYLGENMFNPKINIGEDKELWMRIILETNIKCTLITSVVINKHDDRSIHLKNIDPVFKHRNLINKLSITYKDYLSKKTIRITKSHAEFSIAKHFIYTDYKIKSIYFILRSIFKNPIHKTTKHKLIVILSLIKLYPQKAITSYKNPMREL